MKNILYKSTRHCQGNSTPAYRVPSTYTGMEMCPLITALSSLSIGLVMLRPNKIKHFTWWRHPMETISVLLAICVGNSPVAGEFPTQRPVTRSFGVFFDLRLNRRVSEHSWGWWFETPAYSLWRHCNEDSCCHTCQATKSLWCVMICKHL